MSIKYRETIINRKGTIVFRPDSGNPVDVNSKLIDTLWDIFGGEEINGYKLLISQVRLIQGDGIDKEMLQELIYMLMIKKYSVDNIVFGSGGGLLQKFNRDTCKFAIKASYGERIVDNKLIGFAINKNPLTSTDKRSKPGILKLHKVNEDFPFITISSMDKTFDEFESYTDELELVFENGTITREQTFKEIRDISETYLEKELSK